MRNFLVIMLFFLSACSVDEERVQTTGDAYLDSLIEVASSAVSPDYQKVEDRNSFSRVLVIDGDTVVNDSITIH